MKFLIKIHITLTQGQKLIYGKCSKISNTFLFLLSNKTWVIRTGIHKMLVHIANSEDPDQTGSDLGLHCLLRLFGR